MAMDEGMCTPNVGATLVHVSRIETTYSVVRICGGWYL